MKILDIIFGEKFTQNDLDIYLNNFFQDSISENFSDIVFNLELLEWIGSEEITFLFSWIRRLRLINKKVKIKLPYSYKKNENESDKVLERRQFIKFYLWKVWGINNLGVEGYDFENTDDINDLLDAYDSSTVGKKVLPFQIIKLKTQDKEIPPKFKIDKEYKELIRNKNGNGDVFTLESKLKKLLDDNDCYTPFENKVISEIITKELIMNSFEHSETSECYFTTTLINKWTDSAAKSTNFKNQFLLEKEKDILSFYRDKRICLDIVKKKINESSRKFEYRAVNLNKISDYDKFKNQSFLEFSFIDYGRGIYNTLKENFEVHQKIDGANSVDPNILHIDTKVLEYAFQLDSSKDPFDRKIEYYDLIPRGLYFLIDMVRRYKGLLIARSGYGKVTYDFSEDIIIKNGEAKIEKKYSIKDAIIYSNDKIFFEGTMFSIILPERKKEKFKKSGVRLDNIELNKYVYNRANSSTFPRELFHTNDYHYLSLSFIFNVIDTNIEYSKYNHKEDILNLVFHKINDKLNELKDKNCLLFIDFECLPDRSNVLRILLYLSNTPLVNEFTKVVILNIDEEEFKLMKEYEKNILDENATFLFKPIPCLKLNFNNVSNKIENIQWIGVRNIEDEKTLTSLFFGKNESIDISKVDDKWLAEGNVFAKFEDRVYSIFSNFTELIDIANQKKTEEFLKYIQRQITDISEKYPNTVFLTSKGTYQKDYLTLYEPLNFKYTARYFAEFLLDCYIQNEIIYFENKYNLLFKDLSEERKEKIRSEIRFDKILAVTVSSQLIAVEIRNLIRDTPKYKFLLKNYDVNNSKPSLEKNCPKIIKLSSYISFENEKPFNEIKERDKIILVNDVISTGSLVKRIKVGVEKRNAIVKSVLAIADSRKRNVDKTIEQESVFFDDIIINTSITFENKIVSIISSEKNKEFRIFKYKNKPREYANIKRINPILNTIISLKENHAEKNRIIYKSPEKLFDELDIFNNDVFKIGHFKQNRSCNSYFIKMEKIFHDNNGKKLLKKLKYNLENNPNLFIQKENQNTNQELKKSILAIEKLLLAKNINIDDLLKDVDSITHNYELESKEDIDYQPDLIFYPVYSGIEEVTENTFHQIFRTDKANIVSMQRYETKNGWRFPFPPKRLNNEAKNKHVLIIDSGALSGQSLVQLIDSISFLEVKRIDVLSVIARLDDYNREFYSRLRSIKVKILNNPSVLNEKIVDLNVLFGTNIHIPSFHSEEVCIYCKEIVKLKNYLNEFDLIPETEKYIRFRINEIKQRNSNNDINISYIPVLRNLNVPDTKDIFLIRDKIGKVDSYRFYNDYFTFFDDEIFRKFTNINDLFKTTNQDLLKRIELILICVLHEPNLILVLKDLLSNIYDICNEFINTLVNDQDKLNRLYYKWSSYSVLMLIFIFKKETFYKKETLESLYNLISDEPIALDYFSFLIYEPFLQKENKSIQADLMSYFYECNKNNYQNFKDNNIESVSIIIKHILNKLKPIKADTNLLQAFYNLNIFFLTDYTESHNKFIKSNLNEISGWIQNKKIENIKDVLFKTENVIKILKNNLLMNINVLTSNSHVKNLFSPTLQDVANDIELLETEYDIIKKQKDSANFYDIIGNQLFIKIRDFQHNYLELNTQFNFICTDFDFKFKVLLSDIINSSSIQNYLKIRNNFVIDIDSIEENLILQGNRGLIFSLYEEIIKNSVKREEHNNTVLKFSILEHNNSNVKILISQNKGFIEQSPKKESEKNGMGGFKKIVENILINTGYGDIEIIKNANIYNLIITHNYIQISYGK